MMYDGLFCAFDQVRHGRRHREVRRQPAGIDPRAPGRARRPVPRAGRRRARRTGCSTTRSSPVDDPAAQGRPDRWSTTDEGVRAGTTAESLGGCARRSTTTAPSPPATPSQISDGGAAVDRHVEGQGRGARRPPLAEIVGYGKVAGPDPSLLTQPSQRHQEGARASGQSSATSTCSRSTRRSPRSAWRRCATWASATRSSTSTVARSPRPPIGASGARVALHLALELRRRGGGWARQACAAAAARARPCSWTCLREPRP